MICVGLYPLYTYAHDANVALVRDGEVLFAYEEERLTRSQHAATGPGDPIRTLIGALTMHGLKPADVDLWALCGMTEALQDPASELFKRLGLRLHVDSDDNAANGTRISHHTAHAAAAVLTSPFDRCLFFSFDGGGDDGYSRIGAFDSVQGFRMLENTKEDMHIGNFYSAVTSGIGFGAFEEGKTMGLASYGKVRESLYRKFAELLYLDKNGMSVVFEHKQIRKGPGWRPEKFSWQNFRQFKLTHPVLEFPTIPELHRYNRADVAATLQRRTEDLVLEIVSNVIRTSGIRDICLTGGLFYNVVLNKKIRELPEVNAVHVPMAAGDAGLALGCALAASWDANRQRPGSRPVSPYLGPEFDDENVREALDAYGLEYSKVESPARAAATHIADGKVVGWFQGRGEYGPRALGARSVLADPRSRDAKARVNQLLKKRDWFMPYAPSILEGYEAEYLENPDDSPYMAMAFDMRKEKVEQVPGAVHVDGTTRPQIVRKAWNPAYHALIDAFREITGVPMVLNTSFNQHGEAMVATPQHAIEHLLRGAVDVLVIGGFEAVRKLKAKPESAPQVVSEQECIEQLQLEPASRALAAGNADLAMTIMTEDLGFAPEAAEQILRGALEQDQAGSAASLEPVS